MEALKESKKQLYDEVDKVFKKLCHARNLCYQLESRYQKLKAEYERVDYELAMKDGRFQRVAIQRSKPKEPVVTLTQEQIISIAKKLGIEIRMNEPREEEEEE